MKKYVFLFLLTLLATHPSFADESTSSSNAQLQNIIDLFQNDLNDDALTQLILYESDLVASIHKSKDAESYMLLGRAYFYAEMDAKAIDVLNTALQIDQSLSDAHFFIGLIHRYANDLDAAEKSFQDAIAVNGDEANYFVALGETLEMKSDAASAVIAYKNALMHDDRNITANFNLATIYAVEGSTSAAERHYLAVIQQEPDNINSHYNLGQLYQNTKQHRSAIKQFQKVVDLDPNQWRAIEKLVQENEALNAYAARDLAIERIYELWRSNTNAELNAQGFYIREQSEIENGNLFVLEYFELKGDRARKYVFKLQDAQTGDMKFDVSLGSYEATNAYIKGKDKIEGDERIYHLDGYAPNGIHYTYAFFDALPSYDAVKDIVLKVLAGEDKPISSTVLPE